METQIPPFTALQLQVAALTDLVAQHGARLDVLELATTADPTPAPTTDDTSTSSTTADTTPATTTADTTPAETTDAPAIDVNLGPLGIRIGL